MNRGVLAVCLVALAGCEKPAPPTPTPSLSTTPSPSPTPTPTPAPSPAPSSSAPPTNGPPTAIFREVTTAKPLPIRVSGCDQVVVAFVRGKGTALGDALGTNDLLLAQGEGTFDVKGDGTALIARVMPKQCSPTTTVTKKIVRASVAKDLAWAGGAMHAHLDLEGDASPAVYVGRLEGTAPVAEHTHPGAWEVLCAVEGAGLFTLDGRVRRLGPRDIVVVPPDTKHSWMPDAKTKLVAVQIYTPPGPEQRFKKLAADAADAGK